MVEKRTVKESFAKYINGAGLAGKKECIAFIEEHQDILEERIWKNLKDCVRNMQIKENKDTKKLFK